MANFNQAEQGANYEAFSSIKSCVMLCLIYQFKAKRTAISCKLSSCHGYPTPRSPETTPR